MSNSFSPDDVVSVFSDYAGRKGYQFELVKINNGRQLVISDSSIRTIVVVYNSCKIDIQGKKNLLREEIYKLKTDFDMNPKSFLGDKFRNINPCTITYDIMLPELRNRVFEFFKNNPVLLVEILPNAKLDTIDYRAKISKNNSSLTLTQFSKGTLLLQGKSDLLFDECCDSIEKISKPSEKEVISRFISDDQNCVSYLSENCSSEIINTAESNVINKVGEAYRFLETYDQKWFVASECLCLTKVPLPEFSPLVMPASKAFEGFAKKLLLGIGLYEPAEFQKVTNFKKLSDESPEKKNICDKQRHARSMLKRLSADLDTYRNFMMHSDDENVTKIDTRSDAEFKVEVIFKDTKEIFEYFNPVYKLLGDE